MSDITITRVPLPTPTPPPYPVGYPVPRGDMPTAVGLHGAAATPDPLWLLLAAVIIIAAVALTAYLMEVKRGNVS